MLNQEQNNNNTEDFKYAISVIYKLDVQENDSEMDTVLALVEADQLVKAPYIPSKKPNVIQILAKDQEYMQTTITKLTNLKSDKFIISRMTHTNFDADYKAIAVHNTMEYHLNTIETLINICKEKKVTLHATTSKPNEKGIRKTFIAHPSENTIKDIVSTTNGAFFIPPPKMENENLTAEMTFSSQFDNQTISDTYTKALIDAGINIDMDKIIIKELPSPFKEGDKYTKVYLTHFYISMKTNGNRLLQITSNTWIH